MESADEPRRQRSEEEEKEDEGEAQHPPPAPEAALLPRYSRQASSSDYSSSSNSWHVWMGIGLLVLILSVFVAATVRYVLHPPQSTRGAPHYSAEGTVTGAGDLPLPDLQALQHFDVRDYGAMGDGVTLNTDSFRKALKAASDNGGGVVQVTDGRYLMGAIDVASSHTYLYIAEDAIILGSTDESDYPFPDSWEPAGDDSQDKDKTLPILIRFKHLHHVGILGRGVVDGGAVPGYVQRYDSGLDKLVPRTFRPGQCLGECRPRLVLVEQCDEVVVHNVTMQNSPDWTLHIRGSSNVLLSNLRIHGDWRWPNNDGMDIDSSVNVTVVNNTVDTGDDAFCIKSTVGYGPTRNILMRDNVAKSRSAAFKIGSATMQDISDIFVDRFYVMAGTNRGLGIQHRDVGNVYNVHFRHVVLGGTVFQTNGWWGNAEPVYISSIPRHVNGNKNNIGTVSNITLEDVKAHDAANGVFVSSRGGANALVNLSFVNVHALLVQYPNDWKGKRLPPEMTPGINYSLPQRDYRPTEIEPQIVPSGPKIDAVYMEGVNLESVVCKDSSVTFVKGAGSDSGGGWWGSCLGGQNVDRTRLRGLKCVFGGLPF